MRSTSTRGQLEPKEEGVHTGEGMVAEMGTYYMQVHCSGRLMSWR